MDIFKKVNPSHDLNNHVRFMQELYGKDSINMDKVKSVVFLDLLDPILFASIYSTATGEAVKIPALNIGNGISITPKMNVVLTPYGVVEKRVTTYINTNYTPIMVSFGFGKEQKTDKPYYEYSSYKRYINNLDFMCKINPSDNAKQAERRYAGTIYSQRHINML